jgi:hypothetical protein
MMLALRCRNRSLQNVEASPAAVSRPAFLIDYDMRRINTRCRSGQTDARAFGSLVCNEGNPTGDVGFTMWM